MFGRDARVGQGLIDCGHREGSNSAPRKTTEGRHADTGD
jgi:hypothetical protein